MRVVHDIMGPQYIINGRFREIIFNRCSLYVVYSNFKYLMIVIFQYNINDASDYLCVILYI